MTRCKILVVDDNTLFLSSATRLLEGDPDLEIVGQALSGLEALRQVEALRPDVVVLDITLPDLDGIAAARLIKAQPAAPRVVLITLYDSEEYRRAATASRADSFLAKTEFGTQIVPLLRDLCQDAPAGCW